MREDRKKERIERERGRKKEGEWRDRKEKGRMEIEWGERGR